MQHTVFVGHIVHVVRIMFGLIHILEGISVCHVKAKVGSSNFKFLCTDFKKHCRHHYSTLGAKLIT